MNINIIDEIRKEQNEIKKDIMLVLIGKLKGINIGYTNNIVIGGLDYLASRKLKEPISIKELSQRYNCDSRKIFRAVKKIKKFLGMKFCRKQSLVSGSCIVIVQPKDYISRFSSVLKLSPKTQNDALKVLRDAEKVELTTNWSPSVMAASAIYISSLMNGEYKKQREVADIAGITQIPIRKCYKEIIKRLNLEDKIDSKEARRTLIKKWREDEKKMIQRIIEAEGRKEEFRKKSKNKLTTPIYILKGFNSKEEYNKFEAFHHQKNFKENVIRNKLLLALKNPKSSNELKEDLGIYSLRRINYNLKLLLKQQKILRVQQINLPGQPSLYFLPNLKSISDITSNIVISQKGKTK